ncbi:two-component sensor histidine kinase BarA [Thalassotalea sp. Y01]|uniref:two-component sensor histidine kinase BarA n=1 Tax=Thalassotalea sp. Y01 TaxID=2729613 RepID=UPI00145F5E29|nr:two-component sensor histidine kinase BarA [Thalassotalea sp. Y01]NMP17667.1 two-component sensor histidine kinase BarA [Thalassotalea sp. Y01]
MKITLRDWVILFTVIPLLFVGSGLSLFYAWDRYVTVDEHIEDKAGALVDVLTMQTRLIIESGKLENLHPIYQYVLSRHSGILKNLAIIADDDTVLYNATPTFHPEEHLMVRAFGEPEPGNYQNSRVYQTPNSYLYYVPMVKEGLGEGRLDFRYNYLGYVVFEVSKLPYQAEMRAAFAFSFAAFVVTVLISIAFGHNIVRFVSRPVEELNKAILNIRHGEAGTKISGKFEGEVDLLRLGLNNLSQTMGDFQRDMEMNIESSTREMRQNLSQFETQNVQLELAKRRAVEASQVKSEFLANMSHELRTPLNGVIGFTRQLYKTPLDTNQQEFLYTIENSANNLLSIINDILDFSKLDSGKMALEKVPFSFREAIDEATALLAESANNKGLEFSININPTMPNSLIGDALRIKQVLINLISNAIKFTEQGHVAVDIDYELLDEEDIFITADIRDTGIGISDKQAETLFEAFNQADKSITRLYGGTGLGLVIAKRLANEMDGDINYISKIHQGSTFKFSFHSSINQLPVDAIIEPFELEQKRILFYEPQHNTRSAISRQLKHWHMDVVEVSEMSRLVEILHAHKYDYALIGTQVSPVNIGDIKALTESIASVIPRTTLAINSSSLKMKETFIKAGARDVISKPITYKNLRRALLGVPDTDVEAIALGDNNSEDLTNMKVLAVDDNEANLKLLMSLLKQKVSDLDTATDGRAALELCRFHKYDLILMDVQMPIMDGSMAMEKIRDNTLNVDTPIIAVTAHALPGEKEKFIKDGFDSYLAKPIDEGLLEHIIFEYAPTFAAPRMERTMVEHEQGMVDVGPTSPVFDWPLALQRSGTNPQLALEMFKMLLDSLEQTTVELRHYIDVDDLTSIASLIHKLNGACCYVGIPRLEKVVNDIETQIKKGAILADLEPEFFELFDQIESVMTHQQDFLQKVEKSIESHKHKP